MVNRLGRLWQIAKHAFLVDKNPMKIRCSNTAFYIYWRNLAQSWGKFNGTALVLDTFYVSIAQNSKAPENLPFFPQSW